MGRTAAAVTVAAMLMAACGGGTSTSGEPSASPSASPPTAQATPSEVDVRPEPGLYGREVVAAVPVGSNPISLAATDAGVLVLTQSRELVRIDPTSGQPTVLFDEVGDTGGIVLGPGGLWAASGQGPVTQYDEATGQPTGVTLANVVARRQIVAADDHLVALGFNFDYVPSSGDIGFENGPIQVIDPATGDLRDIPVESDTVDIVAHDGVVFGFRAGDAVLRADLATLEVTHRRDVDVDVPNNFNRISAIVGDELWFVVREVVVRLSLDDLSELGRIEVPGLLGPRWVAAHEGALHVVGDARLTAGSAVTSVGVWRVEPDAVSGAVDLGPLRSFDFFDAVVSGDSLWISKFNDRAVLRIPMADFPPA